MTKVCDDVLQLEKLEKGGFQYVFGTQEVRVWVSQTAFQVAPMFGPGGGTESSGQKNSSSCDAEAQTASPNSRSSGIVGKDRGVTFKWRIETVGKEAKQLLADRPMGVADFLRLDQVVSNFLSNARKFTKSGSVNFVYQIRLPTETEMSSVPQVSHQVVSNRIMRHKTSVPEDPLIDQWVTAQAAVSEAKRAVTVSVNLQGMFQTFLCSSLWSCAFQ
uniref:Uncharacterized protein n=1 Tax=Chromera velia CCMP2878 TaxID=1169474 RepID=A0A0G4HZG2_9ALVE|eukprot:Cvel_9726.t1-p1 / transcript=Cvel_9726.t1 / gene=Cvel_9726 / organism=Chromera_velia_CCMP2878 / gene_product=hypothetical protein / transcript_product=hypothetical protein / location=Cvel_scaffold568:49615-50262(+) / protein_length=216 / sequence_SO=supercontig / SO=protein_coding / is_pseudo=false